MDESDDDRKLALGLDQFFLNHERTGKPIWRGGAFAEMYFSDGHLRDKRQALIDVWKRYYALFPDKLTHFLPNDGTRLSGIDDGFPPQFDAVMPTIDESLYFDGRLAGFEDSTKTSWPPLYMVSGAGIWDREPDRLSSNVAYFPASYVLEDEQWFVAELLAWCDLLKPRHGLAGLSLLRNPSSPPYEMRDTRAFPFLKRFPGLDYTDSAQFSLITRRAPKQLIRGSNWLTIFDDAFVAELGGMDALDAALPQPEITIHRWDGGVLIQAGPHPELGDVNAGRRPSFYSPVAQTIAPIRFEGYTKKGYFRVPPPLDEVAETLAWVRRFDP